jgi:hypothetical protein
MPAKAVLGGKGLRRASAQFPPRLALALVLLPLLSGCLGAVALPLLAGGTLMATDKHRVRAATQVAAPAKTPATVGGRAEETALSSSTAVLTSLKELPRPNDASAGPADDSWQLFFAYAQALPLANEGKDSAAVSALLKQPPSIDTPIRLPCGKKASAVVIDLDDGPQAFAPERLGPAPAVAEGLSRLREAGVVILWISRLPAGRAADVAQALRASGLDPQGQDQLLLLRNAADRKQLLREDASEDVCVFAIAGDQRGDFDELFDYLRNPGSAVGLYPLMGHGWFLVPSLAGTANPSTGG